MDRTFALSFIAAVRLTLSACFTAYQFRLIDPVLFSAGQAEFDSFRSTRWWHARSVTRKQPPMQLSRLNHRTNSRTWAGEGFGRVENLASSSVRPCGIEDVFERSDSFGKKSAQVLE